VAGLAQKLLGLDRRWLFLLVFLGVATPIILPIGLPVTTTGPTRSAYEFVEALPLGASSSSPSTTGPRRVRRMIQWRKGSCAQCFVKKLP